MLARMGAIQFLLPLCIGTVVVIVLVQRAFFSNVAKLRRSMRTTPHTRIVDSVDGSLVRIIGRVEAVPNSAPLEAPFSRRTSVYFFAAAYEAAGKSGSRLVAAAERAVPFLVRDESGVAYVDLGEGPPRNMSHVYGIGGELQASLVDAGRDYAHSSGIFDDPDAHQQEFLQKHGIQTQTMLMNVNKSFQYHEQIIEVGEKVCLLGIARHEPESAGDGVITPGPSYRGSAKKLRVTLVAPPNARIGLSDSFNTTD